MRVTSLLNWRCKSNETQQFFCVKFNSQITSFVMLRKNRWWISPSRFSPPQLFILYQTRCCCKSMRRVAKKTRKLSIFPQIPLKFRWKCKFPLKTLTISPLLSYRFSNFHDFPPPCSLLSRSCFDWNLIKRRKEGNKRKIFHKKSKCSWVFCKISSI